MYLVFLSVGCIVSVLRAMPISRDGIGSDLDRIFQNPYPILNKNNISISISICYG